VSAYLSHSSVLVVDDDPALRRLISLHLRRLGCRVIEAQSVAQAIAVLETQSPDVIVSDYSMPLANGLDLLEYVRLRQLDVEFILSSALLPDDVAAEAWAAGAVVVPKDELIDVLSPRLREAS
jgi:two-component system, NtrC family, response regulator AtoC